MIMGGVGVAFRCDVSKETLNIFFQYLHDYSIETVSYAAEQIVKTCDRFPTVKQLREYAGAYRKPVNYIPSTSIQIEEFTQSDKERFAGPMDGETADDFFNRMLGDVSKRITA